MGGLLIAGTSSDAGKSLVSAGLCRALHRRGVDVAPFKAQNMSNNSMICPGGAEIGRAQWLQAVAARVPPSADMNPVLLKPGDDRTSHIVVDGYPHGVLRSGEYATGRDELARAAFAAYSRLAGRHQVVICEGAGSPAEINLRHRDYVNMGLARRFALPVVLVGDIDRGGLLASLYGTWALLEKPDRDLLSGYVINKFRGDVDVLRPGLEEITGRTGMACLGVLPWLRGMWLDGEDVLTLGRWRSPTSRARAGSLRVAVVALPRISNATDVDALAHEPGVQVLVTEDPDAVAGADLAVLPGTRATVSDLDWVREHGIDTALRQRVSSRSPILGICGGFEMLGESIVDDVESGLGTVPGLGLLPVRTHFGAERTQRLAAHRWGEHVVHGYEIHHGQCRAHEPVEAFLDGVRSGPVWATMLHGALEHDEFRRDWLTHVARQAG
ncbi:MAG: cobyric acid synthase CobQ, partial [Micrococcales bacterium]